MPGDNHFHCKSRRSCAEVFIFPNRRRCGPARGSRGATAQNKWFFRKRAIVQSTRIKPAPGDVIKLEDRLHYLLQPSLETLLNEGG